VFSVYVVGSKICFILCRFLTSGNIDLYIFGLNVGASITPVLQNVYANFVFFNFLLSSFELRAHM